MILDNSRTLQSTPESGSRAGYDGAKKRQGTKVHIVVDTLGHLLTLSGRGVELIVVKRPEVTKGFILLPKRWVVEVHLPGCHASGGWDVIWSAEAKI